MKYEPRARAWRWSQQFTISEGSRLLSILLLLGRTHSALRRLLLSAWFGDSLTRHYRCEDTQSFCMLQQFDNVHGRVVVLILRTQ